MAEATVKDWMHVGVITCRPDTPAQAAEVLEYLQETAEEKSREIIMYSEADDERVGGQVSLQVGGHMGIVDDPELAAYVSSVGKRVARHAPRESMSLELALPRLEDALLEERGRGGTVHLAVEE